MDDVMDVIGRSTTGDVDQAREEAMLDALLGGTKREYTEWHLPVNAPNYLQPRDEMRSGHVSDPELRDLVDQAWTARIQLHLTVRGNSHPASREDVIDQCRDLSRDIESLYAAQLRIGQMLLGQSASPVGLSPFLAKWYVRLVGDALLQTCYMEGCSRIELFEELWHHSEWDKLAAREWISIQEAEELKLWTSADYDALVRCGLLCDEEAEYLRGAAASRTTGSAGVVDPLTRS